MSNQEVMASIAIMAGDNHIGEVVELWCARWQATDAKGRSLGEFPDQRRAALAVINSTARSIT